MSKTTKITARNNTNSYNNKGFSFARDTFMATVLGLLVLGVVGCSSGGGSGSDAAALTVSVTDASVVEGDSGTQQLKFTVSLSEPVASATTVDYKTSDGTASTAGADYTATSGKLTIPANTTSESVTVEVNGDTDFEFDETLTLTLSNPSGLALGTAVATGTITNDDDAVNTTGYFTGTANVKGVTYSDVIALAYGDDDRIMVFSPTANVLYDITVTNVTVNDFEGDVDVYVDGNKTSETVTVSGTTNESQVQATFAGGTGFGAGSFDILFDTANNRGATLARIETPGLSWEGNYYGIDVDTGTLSSNVAGLYTASDVNDDSCLSVGDFSGVSGIPDPDVNIYRMAHDVVDQGFENCASTYKSTGHTGFASVIDNAATDDRVVFSFSNGTFALFGILDEK